MAHIPTSAAIFSPSVARLASSVAKDWSYVDSWLATKYQGRSPPPFERNPETLKVLVALAALNESADEERDLVTHLELASLQTLSSVASVGDPGSHIAGSSDLGDIMSAISAHLSREGQIALDALSETAVKLGIAFPESETLVKRILELQNRTFQLEQDAVRGAMLQAHISEELSQTQNLLQKLGGKDFQPAADLAKLNLELRRKVKTEAARVQDSREKSAGTAVQTIALTVQQVQIDEAIYMELLDRKKDLDHEIMSFQGLPPDQDLARQQLETLREELRAVVQRRDLIFENLVERETPRKPGPQKRR